MLLSQSMYTDVYIQKDLYLLITVSLYFIKVQQHSRVAEFFAAWSDVVQNQELIQDAKRAATKGNHANDRKIEIGRANKDLDAKAKEDAKAKAKAKAEAEKTLEKNIHRIQTSNSPEYHYVKVRPGVYSFLHDLKDFYEFHIFTHG